VRVRSHSSCSTTLPTKLGTCWNWNVIPGLRPNHGQSHGNHARINFKLLGFDGDTIGDRVQAPPTSHPYCDRR